VCFSLSWTKHFGTVQKRLKTISTVSQVGVGGDCLLFDRKKKKKKKKKNAFGGLQRPSLVSSTAHGFLVCVHKKKIKRKSHP
jgi:hypothetical protein